MRQYFFTWFIIVEHEEEVDQPGQLHRLEHLTNESKLTEVNHKPRFLLSYLGQGKVLHDGDEALLGEHIILQLHVELSSTLGVHHEEAEVQGLLGSPGDSLHVISQSLLE